MLSRNKVAAVAAEFLGTGILTLVIVSVQRSTIGVPYFVGLAAGLTAAIMVLAFGRASGAQLNPGLTIGLWTARRIKTLQAVVFVAAQLLGGYLAGLLYRYFVNGNVAAIGGKFDSRVLIGEAVGAAIFTMAAAAAIYHRHTDSKKAALYGGGLSLGIIAASAASAGILNPAVALGANAWTWGTFVLGPILGGIIGVNLYGLLFAPAVVVVATATTQPSAVTAPVAVSTATKRKTTARKTTAKKPATRKKSTTSKRK